MILKGAEIGRYLARPDPTRPGLLIYGQDAMRVALKRAEAVKALVGAQAEEEMRLTRLPGADLRKDPAQLMDAVNYARANGLEQCIVYSYIRHWNWEPTDPWPAMMAQVSAMPDVWSVGYGHLALYQRTRDRVVTGRVSA